jgi:glycosyltransferase involved in cell wall biosynthesis
MITVHFVVESFDRKKGGMEESAARIVQSFRNDPDIRFVGYLIRKEERSVNLSNLSKSVSLTSEIRPLIQPLGIEVTSLSSAVQTRLQILSACKALRQEIRRRPKDRHILLSFFVPTAGFIAQHLSHEVGISHIACARGSDLGHKLFMPDSMTVLNFVMTRATHVVTTSLQHQRLVTEVFGRSENVHTIYNALSKSVQPVWRRHRSRCVHLVSATGYCIKKGTHLLVKAVAQLLDEGLPIDLSIVGPTRLGSWDKFQKKYRERYPSKIQFNGMIPYREVRNFLLSGDIYCSASYSEGCSNATMLALGLGMPIVSTATGALVDFSDGLRHVQLADPASHPGLIIALREMVNGLLDKTISVDQLKIKNTIDRLSMENERKAWKRVFFQAAGHAPPAFEPSKITIARRPNFRQ